MSVRVMSWVFEHSKATGNDRLVLLAIADRCDDDGGNCWKSTAALAAKAKVSKRTAQRCIDHLVAMGELSIEERPGTTNMLTVVMDEGRQVVTPDAEPTPARGVKLSPLTAVTPRQPDTRDTSVQGGVTTVSPDTSKNHPSTPQPPAEAGVGGPPKARGWPCRRHSKPRNACAECKAEIDRIAAEAAARERRHNNAVFAEIAEAKANAVRRPREAAS